MIWIILIIAAIITALIFKIIKIPKFGNMTLVTGGIKTGKSTMTIYLAVRQYNRQLRKYKIYNLMYKIFHKLFKKMKKKEKPLFYSNIPIAVKNYVPLTLDLIERKKRFRYGSVCYFCESSLVADSQAIKDQLVNERLLLLNKLFAHETKGGYVFYDTQSISDNHYAVKRCLSTYFYIHHMKKIPFFCLAWVRELKFSEDNSSVNTFDSDVEDSLQMVIIPKAVWKLFDCYCYSILTDHLEVEDHVVPVMSNKKAAKIISFRKYATIEKEFIDNETEKS